MNDHARGSAGGAEEEQAEIDAPTAATAVTVSDRDSGPVATARVAFPPRYQDLGPIARGGWGEVRRVRDLAMDRVVVAKVLAREHLHAAGVRSRFLNEARVTAALDHPGIVPILDGGTLEDGRPWFAMKEVHGRTLHDLLHGAGAEAESATRLRRMIEVLVRVCEIVGYAHERGVVHRDLKPGNIMVGRFGEVLVLDWGIARMSDDPPEPDATPVPTGSLVETRPGEVLGTVVYMSPEQARGAHREIGPASDVYAIGLVLHELLSGERARKGTAISVWAQAAKGDLPELTAGPKELQAIVARATAVAPSRRFPHAMAVADALREWLDGVARVQRAERAVAQAALSERQIDALRAERDALRAAAWSASADVADHDPVEKKMPIWQLEDRAAELALEIARLETIRVETLRSALEHEPTYAPAHAELARIHRARLVDAERRNALADAALHELLLRQHDRGEHGSFLRALGRVVLDSAPSRAEAVLHRWVLRQRRLVLEEVGALGPTPIDVELPAGSYLLELRRGGAITRYPVVVGREEIWDVVRPGDDRPRPIALLEDLAADEIHVPAGYAWVGQDDLAAQPVPAARVWVDGFVMRRFPVTCREYLEFLDDVAREDEARALALAPGVARGASASPTPAVVRTAGRFAMAPDEHGRAIDPDCPVASIDWRSAMAYARWLAARTGLPWRLPNELEWEKAARGADKRAFPWGHHPEPTWARILGCTADAPERAPVDSHPIDESPYGVRGLAGNVRDWCINAWKREGPAVHGGVVAIDEAAADDPAPRTIRGGGWTSVIAFARSAGRFAAKPDERFAVVGLRLVRSV